MRGTRNTKQSWEDANSNAKKATKVRMYLGSWIYEAAVLTCTTGSPHTGLDTMTTEWGMPI